VLVEWDPYTFSILTEEPGTVKFKDILERDLDREMEYAFDADEPMAGRAPSGDVE
jgi:hypothetical protein